MTKTLQDEIRELEDQLASPTIRASADALDRLVSEEFVEFGSTGLTDFRVLALTLDVALATYRTDQGTPASAKT